MINLEENELLIRCSCHSSDHIAFLIHDPITTRDNTLKGEQDDWYLSVMLDHFTFWKRVKKAFQYIFSPHSIKYGMSSELVLTNDDVDAIVKFIQKRKELYK